MATSPLLRFKDGVELAEAADDQLVVRWPAGRLTLKQTDDGLVAALRALANGGAPEDALADLAADDGPTGIARLYLHLRRFRELDLMEFAVVAEDRLLATLVPISTEFAPRRRPLEAARYVLSRFAFCRRDGERLVLDSPRADSLMRLEDAAVLSWLARLARPVPPDELVAGADGLPMEGARTLLELLLGVGLVSEAGTDGAAQEDDDPAVRQWEFHDLLFHRRTRIVGDRTKFGGTYRFLGQIEPLPAAKPPMSGAAVELARPDLEALKVGDVPFTAVMEGRRSVRTYGERSVTVRELGELLFRAARVRRVVDADPARDLPYAASSRPYPGGGACYELELYPVVNRCAGLEPGLYHYDPLAHVLRRLRERDELVEQLIQDVAWVTGGTCEPQVVLGITARFQRVSWKYERMAYALILKDVGVLYQTLYLVATAMGLGPCGVGGGQAELLARAIGSDYLAEAAVGEFLLGSRPDR